MNNLDAFIGLLLFLAGAPALILQFSSSTVRNILLKHSSVGSLKLYWPLFIAALLVLITNLLNTQGVVEPRITEPILLGSLLTLVFAVCLLMLAYARPAQIAARLTRTAIQQLKKTGQLSDESIETIIGMGIESSPGGERDQILNLLSAIMEVYLQHPDYRGNQLSRLIEGLQKILSEGSPSTSENYRSAGKILKRVLLSARDGAGRRPDQATACKVLGSLGAQTLNFPNTDVTIAFIDALNDRKNLSTAASQSLYEIAAAALEKDKALPAMRALEIIAEAFYAASPNLPNAEVTYDYLSLLAAFWQHGSSGQFIAERDLNDLSGYPGFHLEQQVHNAIEHHREKANFGVSDQIQEMWNSYKATSARRKTAR